MQHTIWGQNGKKLEDDLFVDVDPMNYEVCKNYMIKALKWIKPGSVANDNRFLMIKFCVIQKFCAKMTGTLKSHTDFKTIWLLQKSTQQHEILHAKYADQDLYRSERYVVLEYLKTHETPCSF